MKRFELLEKLIKENGYRFIAEVGVRYGETTKHILSNCDIDKYFAVDIEKKIEDLPKVKFFEMDSIEGSKNIPDESLDLVFIDADHSEEAVFKDITAWIRKVRSGGIICGHDYDNPPHPGVKKAVDKYFKIGHVDKDEDCYVWSVKV